jgi:hypothetical protein
MVMVGGGGFVGEVESDESELAELFSGVVDCHRLCIEGKDG